MSPEYTGSIHHQGQNTIKHIKYKSPLNDKKKLILQPSPKESKRKGV